MNKLTNLLFLTGLFLLFTGCKTHTGDSREEALVYNPYVEAFTSGKISRYSPVYLIFNQEIADEKLNSEQIKKFIKIKPDISGEFEFENNRTIIFKPANELERNTAYKVTADLSDWFDVTSKDKLFTFGFTTFPLAFRANLESMDVNSQNSGHYDLEFTIQTPDREPADAIEPLIQFSETAEAEWQHSPDGKRHRLVAKNIQGGSGKARSFTLNIGPNKLKVPQENLITVSVPEKDKFSVFETKLVTEPEQYVEVTFSKQLDASQNMEGLAYIDNNSSNLVNVEGNKLRLYPDGKKRTTLDIYLSQEIKSSDGKKLNETIIRTLHVNDNVPNVEFVNNGVIIPQSTELIVPFRSVYLRGILVRVIRISEQNIGQFLQANQLNGSNELMRTGRLIARKTIFLDEDDSIDLSNWNHFAIDLRKLIEPEPGAIYRIELSFNHDLSAYPCDNERLSKEQILAQDEIKFKEEMGRYDEGGYYYWYSDYNWWDYNYEERNNPCSSSFYYNKNIGKNVLVTNLGVVAKRNQNNELTVLVHNILTTQPEPAVSVKVYNYQNILMGEGTTSTDGQVEIRFSSGKPYYIIASQGKQRSYLRIDDGSSLSLSTFDVSGEVVQKGIKGFIYGDRGVWRPGDTLYMGFMLNDREERLPEKHPVVMELVNPLGQIYLKKIQVKNELGLYRFDMPTEPDVPTGAWTVNVSVGGVSFSKRIRIESIKPNRLKINLKLPETALVKGETYSADMHVEWLQGATAKNLKYDIQGTFVSIPTTFKGYNGYHFDDPVKKFESEESNIITGKTDGKGDVHIPLKFELGFAAPGMLTANLVTRVFEESGDFSIDGARLLYSPYRYYVGIRSPQVDKRQLDTGSSHMYEVVTLDYSGKVVANKEVKIKVYKVSWYWWWSSETNGLANYISNSYNTPKKEINLQTDANGKATFSLQFDRNEWGSYYISATEAGENHSSGILNYYDWPEMEGRRDREGNTSANILQLKTDKETYQPGEKMILTLPSAEFSRALVSIETGSKVLSVKNYTCREGETHIPIEITEDMQPNAYAYVTLLQPHAQTENDMPIRLYGVTPFTVTSPKSYLHPVIRTADEYKPEEKYEITISEENGREMAYTLAIVDEGLLDLTRFPTPDPWKAFNAHEALGITSWDLYDLIVGAYGGRLEQTFSIGGDDALNKGPKAIVNRFKPVVQFDGPFLLKKGEKKKHTYTMPNYNGRVRVMVVAGDGKAYGHTEKSVMVRKPVMLLGTLPRVIGIGEEMTIPATVFATEKGIGKVEVSISCSSNMEIIGASTREILFSEAEDKQALFRIRVKNAAGAGKVTLTATGKGEKTVYDTDIEIRSVRRPQTKVATVTLEGGKTWNETIQLPGADGTNQLALEISNIPPVNLTSRLSYLIGYPHGCIEQITSKGFPQLYVGQFASLTKEQELTVENAVKEVISRMRSYQTADGAFSYWPGGSNSYAWATIYATHFLLEAEAKGYMVPESMKRNVLNHLRKVAREWKPVDNLYRPSEEMIQTYRLFVLALAQMGEIGAMNRIKENNELNPVARWLLASAYSLIGRKDVALELTEKTVSISDTNNRYSSYDLTYGSPLRDNAIRLQTLTLLEKTSEAAELVREISASLSSDNWYSTQTTAYSLLALSQYIGRYHTDQTMRFSYTAGNKNEHINSDKNIWTETLLQKASGSAPVEVKNQGNSTLFVRVITEGTPDQGMEEAYQNEMGLNVAYTDMNGKLVDVSQLEQGVNFTAVVTIKNPTASVKRNLVLTQIFPAGWEILNTRFLNEGATDTQTAGLSYQDIRDDRVYSYIDLLSAGREVTIRINLCAVYPGQFYLPPVYCEAMYDHLVRANTEGKTVEVE